MANYLAIDIGASSGRHIISNNSKLHEVYRFKTGFVEKSGRLICNLKALRENVIEGIRLAFEHFGEIQSLAIDTWGVDYVLMNGDKEILPCVSYRDNRTESVVDKVHNIIPFHELYSKTGIQFQPFNTIYQLFEDKLSSKLQQATDFLMLPEYLNYVLTGKKVKEYTNATTTGLVNVTTKSFDTQIIEKLGLPTHIFYELKEAGTIVGELTPDIQKQVNGNCKVLLCLSHDTASAVYGIPMEDESPYLSSGTWGLLGVTQKNAHTDKGSMSANYSNEGGINKTFRYQKNITGMWAVNRVIEELNVSDVQIFVELAKQSAFCETVNLNDGTFLNPKSFVKAINQTLQAYGKPTPKSTGDIANCIFHSFAQLYKEAINQLEQNVGKTYKKLYIVGGGAKNQYLNNLTEQYTKKQIIALPIEATAMGNLKVQQEVIL